MSLHNLEVELLRLLPTLSMKPTLDRAVEAGRILDQVRPLLPHGHWLPWLARVGLTRQSASDYSAVYRHAGDVRPAGHMTIKQFLETIRTARFRDKRAERERVRAEVVAAEGPLPVTVKLAHADCRGYKWPAVVDAAWVDPPWSDLPLYEWAAGWVATTLRPGGLAFVQVGTAHLKTVLDLMAEAGLSYVWTLAMWHPQSSEAKPVGRWVSAWRPVLLMSRGQPDIPPGKLSDGYTSRPSAKPHHDWEQPLSPIECWLSRLVAPGSVLADPFAGSGTTAVAARTTEVRWIGTEMDRATYLVARGRLAKVE
ncbi:MAG: DUF3102 domain-containing protein [Gemmataceae bacterium]|nr:DUF3102 domain-containing protein [Gemmataceae bacterium]